MTTVSIILPAYNEEKTILAILEKVNEQKVENVKFEIIVIEDKSSDRTLERLKSRPDLYTKLIAREKNGGKGAAVKSGLSAATGDYILFQDADLEYEPSDYAKLLAPAIKYNADVVMGSRTLGPQLRRVHYFWNQIGNGLITIIFNLLYNKTFSDVYTCYLMYKRQLINPDELRTMGFDQHAEILAKCVKKGKIFYEVPINYHGRPHEEGKKIRAYHVISVIWAMIVERFK